jgi:Zn-finger nucleic acid-binding protein
MFFGSKFCGHCGAEAVEAKTADDKDLGVCPRCKCALDRLEIQSIKLAECKTCAGVWSDPTTFEKICSEKEEQSAALAFFGARPENPNAKFPVNYVPCPDCKQLMNRSNFARSSGVIIDLCKDHGIWFDAGELPKIVEFIEHGGLTRARAKEKIDLDAEREEIREERRMLGLSALSSDLTDSHNNKLLGGSLIKKLFDL